jgi:hypothetical protein
MIEMGRDGYYHPAGVEEVRALVVEARARGANLRIRGSGHSVAASVRSDRGPASRPGRDGMDVMLDRMRAVAIEPEPDGEHAIVEVDGGCNLGLDPYDPSGTSTWENSLTVRLHRAGWALDALGGISHQTIAGFLMTGSAGGSTTHSLAATVLRLQFVDGTGGVHEADASDTGRQRCLFEAVGVSMGLLGVITKVWLRAVRSYTLAGREVTTPLAECPVDIFGEGRDGRPGLVEFLRNAPYGRILWWPQPRFDRVSVWSASPDRSCSPSARTPYEILTPRQELSASLLQTVVGNLTDVSQVPRQLQSLHWFAHLEQALAGAHVLDRLRPAAADRRSEPDAARWRRACAGGARRVAERTLRRASETGVMKKLGGRIARRMPQQIHRLMTLYVPDGTKEFHDDWHSILPMDDHMDVRLWPASFAELWLPMEAATAAMNRLRDIHHHAGASSRYRLSRAFPVEIYASPKSPFWLSPGYERESVRINPVWLDQWPGDPNDEIYGTYYDALREFGFRPHWGKHLPPASGEWRAYYRRHCPRLDAFLDLRRTFDPSQVFVNDYWRMHLGID